MEEELSWLQKFSNAITSRFGDGIGGSFFVKEALEKYKGISKL